MIDRSEYMSVEDCSIADAMEQELDNLEIADDLYVPALLIADGGEFWPEELMDVMDMFAP